MNNEAKGTVRILGELIHGENRGFKLTMSLDAVADIKSALEELDWELDENGEVVGVDWESGDGGQALFSALHRVLFDIDPEPRRFSAMLSICDIQALTEAEARKKLQKYLGYFPPELDPHIEELRAED